MGRTRYTCPVCDESFLRYESSVTTDEPCCSRECLGLKQRDRLKRTCKNCGEDFEVIRSKGDRQFCSNECQGEASRNKAETDCETCGKTFTAWPSEFEHGKGKYCSVACKIEGRRKDDSVNVSYGRGWREQRRKALERDDYQCQECGMSNEGCREAYGVSLHVHHKKPYREFDDDEEAHALDNLESLCPSCHRDHEGKV